MRERVAYRVDDLKWRTVEEVFGNVGFETTPGQVAAKMSEDPLTGGFTAIMKLPPGWHTTFPESHSTEEEYILVEGDMTFPDEEIRAPHYIYLPPQERHGPVSSKNGALVFITSSGPANVTYHPESPL
jgi:hypothetical protein